MSNHSQHQWTLAGPLHGQAFSVSGFGAGFLQVRFQGPRPIAVQAQPGDAEDCSTINAFAANVDNGLPIHI